MSFHETCVDEKLSMKRKLRNMCFDEKCLDKTRGRSRVAPEGFKKKRGVNREGTLAAHIIACWIFV